MPERDMHGKVVVVTGASDGLGAMAVRRLADRGATVVPIGRSPDKTARVAAGIGVEGLTADFASLAQVRALADRILARCPRIDVLANNAGGVFKGRTITEDGHELMFQVNHLAPYLLTRLLHDRIAASPGARVIQTASFGNLLGKVDVDDLDGERGRHVDYRVYSTAKLLNVIFTNELSRRYRCDGVDAVAASFSPGMVKSSFGSDSKIAAVLLRGPFGRVMLTPDEGARPLVHLATTGDGRAIDGAYYERLRPNGRVHRQATDPALARSLWARSAEMVGLRADTSGDERPNGLPASR